MELENGDLTVTTIGDNKPAEYRDWCRQMQTAKDSANTQVRPNIQNARIGAQLVAGLAYLPYRGLNNITVSEHAMSVIKTFLDAKDNKAKAVIRWIIHEFNEEDIRALNVLTYEMISAIELLERLQEAEEWEFDWPLNTDQVHEKIASFNTEGRENGIFNMAKYLETLKREERAKTDADEKAKQEAKDQEEADKLRKTLAEYRADLETAKIAAERGEKEPKLIKLLRRIAKGRPKLETSSPAPQAGLAFGVDGDWHLFDEDDRIYLLNCLLKK